MASLESNFPKALLAEFIGTFILVFAGVGAIVSDNAFHGGLGHVGVALSFGLVVMSLIYTFGHISGAHFNPAVTLAFTLTKHFPVQKLIPYWLSQVLGASVASIAIQYLMGSVALGITLPSVPVLPAFFLEIILTFFLMIVVMAVATDTRAVGEAAAIAIGGIVALDALFGGPLTGASMNPARSIGPALISGNFTSMWIYIFAPLIGAALGAFTYKWVSKQK